MKSGLVHFPTPTRPRWIVAVFVLGWMSISVVGSVLQADEPTGTESEPASRITTPFDPDTMPPAQKLLLDGLLETPSWTAKVSIRHSPSTESEQASLSGTLSRRENGFSGSLSLAGGNAVKLNFRISKELASAWMVEGEGNDKQQIEELIKGIYLLELLTTLPDQAAPLSTMIENYEVSNLGVTEAQGQRCYVIEAKPKPDASMSSRISSLPASRIVITIGAGPSVPRRVTATLASGSELTLKFESIVSGTSGDTPQVAEQLPKDAVVIDLSGKSPGGALKNPVAYGPESIKRGKLLYIADCEVCHSVDGTGRDSDVTDNAADLTSTEFWLSDGSEAATFLAIRDGAGDEMPGYKDEYRDEKMMWDLVNYIRSLQK